MATDPRAQRLPRPWKMAARAPVGLGPPHRPSFPGKPKAQGILGKCRLLKHKKKKKIPRTRGNTSVGCHLAMFASGSDIKLVGVPVAPTFAVYLKVQLSPGVLLHLVLPPFKSGNPTGRSGNSRGKSGRLGTRAYVPVSVILSYKRMLPLPSEQRSTQVMGLPVTELLSGHFPCRQP